MFNYRKSSENKNNFTLDLKNSEKQIKTYKKDFDSLLTEYSKLDKKRLEVKTAYTQGKETITYITDERIKLYEDTMCKEDILILKNHFVSADSLINTQDKQLLISTQQVQISNQIISEKDRQINLLKSIKPKNKPIGIGLIGGYRTNFRNEPTPFIGIGISYNLIKL